MNLQVKGDIMLYRADNQTTKSSFILRPEFMAMVPGLCQEMIRRHRIRRICKRMSDAELRDIGLSSADIEHALSLPLAKDAGEFLASAIPDKPNW
ncbi:DUF1127 domain-containing protein [Frigidibacter sp. RF13]|uniref:DUF1127 domain-containing protein n=1 Tax=Frigidibacter sp. RF13 TaxID=2997340 RepID=UPI00226D6E58|nr:DUF1127 domain-containing protein [Frigidibacter sp. RF13]MCY1128200.1 DUF1127 domain-containing protein [Frigidibacter sp. RF13]